MKNGQKQHWSYKELVCSLSNVDYTTTRPTNHDNQEFSYSHIHRGLLNEEVAQNENSPCYLHLAVIEQHPVHGVNGPIRCLMSLKVNEAITTGSILITNHLPRAKGRARHSRVLINRRQSSHSVLPLARADLPSTHPHQVQVPSSRTIQPHLRLLFTKLQYLDPHAHDMLLCGGGMRVQVRSSAARADRSWKHH